MAVAPVTTYHPWKGTTVAQPRTVEPRVLRPYQQEACTAVEQDWEDGLRRVAVVLPTGSGKSTVIASLADTAYCQGRRVVMMAHRSELLNQMLDSVRAVNPHIPDYDLGLVRGQHDHSDAPIVAASVQTLLSDHRLARIGRRDVVLWDEVHHIGAQSWHGVAASLGIYDEARFCGFTATMRREDDVALGDVIEKVSYEKDLRWAIDQGFLVQPRGLTVKIPGLRLDKVKMTAGDFQAKALNEMMATEAESIIDAVVRHCADRQMIVFVPGVESAHVIAEMLSAVGIKARSVVGDTPEHERDDVYARYRSKSIQALVTVQVLTEGADFPMCDCVVMARPTKSQVLYSQMVGRAIRLYEGKTDALVVDLVGVTNVHSLVTLTDLDGRAPVVKYNDKGEEDPDPTPEEREEEVEKILRRRTGSLELMPSELLGFRPQAVWLKTRADTPFFESNTHLVFLLNAARLYGDQAADYWAVGYMTKEGRRDGGYLTMRDVHGDHEAGHPALWSTEELPSAMDWAEWLATANLGGFHKTTAPWRHRPQDPSDGQLRLGKMLGIDGQSMSRVHLSDQISIVKASRRLDVG